jgi:hypothetical protein
VVLGPRSGSFGRRFGRLSAALSGMRSARHALAAGAEGPSTVVDEMRRLWLVCAGCLPWFVATPVRADPAPGPEAPSYARLAVGASGNLGFSLGSSCPAAVDDTVSCPGGFLLTGLRLLPRWRTSERWAVGLWGGLAVHTVRESGPTDWWDVQAEVRWYPLGAASREYWLGATAGVVTAIDRVPAHSTDAAPPALHPAHTYVTVGPSGGLGAGFDGTVASFLAIGPELRVLVFGLNTGQDLASSPHYQPHVGFTLGLTLTALADRTSVR